MSWRADANFAERLILIVWKNKTLINSFWGSTIQYSAIFARVVDGG